MATDLIRLNTAEEFMAGYTPSYIPLYTTFLGKSQAYSEEVGNQVFKQATTIGDIKAHRFNPKDTELYLVNVTETRKSFKKYFLANKFQISNLQDSQGADDIIAQVLDEHQIQTDQLFLYGDGTNNTNMLNNGLYWSNDKNYTLNSSIAIAKDAGGSYLNDLHTQVIMTAAQADQTPGRKIILFYGNVLPLFSSLYPNTGAPFKTSLQSVLGPDYSLSKLPPMVSPANANGWVIANVDQLRLNYTTLPGVKKQGANEEFMYYYWNFLMGSLMLDCLKPNAVVRQPTTLAP